MPIFNSYTILNNTKLKLIIVLINLTVICNLYLCNNLYAGELKYELAYQSAEPNKCEKDLLNSFKKIIDPEVDVNIVDLGLLEEIKCPAGDKPISITILLTTPFCPYIKVLAQNIREVCKEKYPHKKNIVIIDTKTKWNANRMTKEGLKLFLGNK